MALNYLQLILIAVSLSCDAFAVSVCDGLTLDLNKRRKVFIAATFGVLQGVMPLIGYFIGDLFIKYIQPFDVWLAFALLLFCGGSMIFEAVKSLRIKATPEKSAFKYSGILLQGLATSIDAFAVGITLQLLSISVWISVSVIAAITFGLCLVALTAGSQISRLFGGKTDIVKITGGVILVLIGIKIVLSHYLGWAF